MSDRELKRIRIIILSLLTLALSIFIIPITFVIIMRPPNSNRFEEYLRRDIVLLTTIKEYFFNEDFENITIRDTSPYEILIGLESERIYIIDEKILNALHRLFQRGYSVISKRDNMIQFQKWSNLDQGRGLVYFFDEQTLGQLRLTTISLSKASWYFYISE